MPEPRSLRQRIHESPGGLVLDGGLASELERRGHDLDHDLWSAHLLLEAPDAVASVIHDFAAAGADLVATATYQATLPGLARVGLSREASIHLIQGAVSLACKAVESVSNRPLVAASIGPYGAFLADGSEYRGDYGLSRRELVDFHRDRMAILTETDCDLFAFETFPSGTEVAAITDLLAEFPDREAWISFSCRSGRELCDGTPIEEIAGALIGHPQVAALGANCIDPGHAVEITERIREADPERSVILYPNAGQGWDDRAGDWKGTDTPDQFARRAVDWRASGATVIGGCCQTTPDHIRALAEKRDAAGSH